MLFECRFAITYRQFEVAASMHKWMSFVGTGDEQRLRLIIAFGNDVTHAANQLQHFHIIYVLLQFFSAIYVQNSVWESLSLSIFKHHSLAALRRYNTLHCCALALISFRKYLWTLDYGHNFYWRCHFGWLSYGEESSVCESRRKRMFEIPKWICEPKYTAEIIIDCGNSTGQIYSLS